jgi:hypothetical protein
MGLVVLRLTSTRIIFFSLYLSKLLAVFSKDIYLDDQSKKIISRIIGPVFAFLGNRNYLNPRISNIYKNTPMRSAFKKITALNKATIFRSLGISIVFMAFYAVVLYILINSPA